MKDIKKKIIASLLLINNDNFNKNIRRFYRYIKDESISISDKVEVCSVLLYCLDCKAVSSELKKSVIQKIEKKHSEIVNVVPKRIHIDSEIIEEIISRVDKPNLPYLYAYIGKFLKSHKVFRRFKKKMLSMIAKDPHIVASLRFALFHSKSVAMLVRDTNFRNQVLHICNKHLEDKKEVVPLNFFKDCIYYVNRHC